MLARSTAFLTTCIDFAYACTCVYATHLELKEQLLGVGSPLPCRFQVSNSGHQPWRQVPLPTEPSSGQYLLF